MSGSLFDSSGQPIRKVTDDQIVLALNTLAKRNQAQQLQLMQLGILVEFLIDKLSSTEIAGKTVFTVNESEFETFSQNRFEEIRTEAARFADLTKEGPQGPAVELGE